ncbi:hypothetical protein NX774_09675 [Massilia agilis]|uniref:Uncharacterized protein n=1 Tax=Massilia agilis TaxID=1811226 RepID=A0ABT2DAK6_9BURK|nr:hypothetical protein [Massilia agilis]MCS0808187.1 hypothetical protein [Massilia agilis]
MNTIAHTPSSRIDIELERERHERQRHDEERTGLAEQEELRTKDARENLDASHLKRSTGR